MLTKKINSNLRVIYDNLLQVIGSTRGCFFTIIKRTGPVWEDDVETVIMEKSQSKIIMEISDVIDAIDVGCNKEINLDDVLGCSQMNIAPAPNLGKA